MSLFRLLYHSNSDLTGSDRTIHTMVFSIAESGAVNNARVGVTGALMFMSGVFVQLLEGPSDAVESVFERICRDTRHRRLVLLDYSATDRRVFPDSGMATFEGDAQAREVFPALTEATSFSRANRLSANMAVDLMERLHRRRASVPNRKQTDWMLATGVID